MSQMKSGGSIIQLVEGLCTGNLTGGSKHILRSRHPPSARLPVCPERSNAINYICSSVFSVGTSTTTFAVGEDFSRRQIAWSSIQKLQLTTARELQPYQLPCFSPRFLRLPSRSPPSCPLRRFRYQKTPQTAWSSSTRGKLPTAL